MEDAICEDVELCPSDGTGDVPGGGHDNQASRPGHSTGNSLAYAQLGAEVPMMVAHTGGH